LKIDSNSMEKRRKARTDVELGPHLAFIKKTTSRDECFIFDLSLLKGMVEALEKVDNLSVKT
jgi:hypothetical protein